MAKPTSKSAETEPSDRPDLRLEEGECVTLSPDSPRFLAVYQQIRPQSIDEVRKVVGLSEAAAQAVAEQTCCRPSTATAALVPAADVNSEDAGVRFRARQIAYDVSREYLSSANPGYLAPWQGLLDAFIVATKAILHAVFLGDIEVADHATLTISSNTHVLYANNVLIHGSGKIVCKGPVKFRINSLKGDVITATLGPKSAVGFKAHM